jgi:hypothetical protein
MILEVRIYRTQPGKRDEFVNLFETRTKQAQEDVGIKILGQFVSLQDPDTFVWLRAFDDQEKRKAQLQAFYGGSEWVNELESIIMPLLADYSNVHVVVPTEGSAIK